MPKKGIQWTDKQKAIRARLEAGLSPQAVIAEGHNKKQVYKVVKAIKAEQGTSQGAKQETPGKPPPGGSTQGETRIAGRVANEVEVGQILIEPADWRVNQEGGLLIIGAYSFAKRTYGYSGTVGDFLCDCANLVRIIMGMEKVNTDYTWKEEDNGRTEERSEGASVLAEAGTHPDGRGDGEPS